MKQPSLGRRAVVIADAPHTDLDTFRSLIQQADLIVAADGGARHLLALQIAPDVAVGDFDSLDAAMLAQLQQAAVEIQRHSVHKNETDLELALLLALERGATTIDILAALGGRPDQHLANLQLLTHPALAEANVRLLDQNWEMFAIHRSAHIVGQPNDLVSLLPMTETVSGIVTSGLFYPLRGEILRLGPARGVSNVLIGTEAHITIERGILLCMHQHAPSTGS